MFCRGHFIGPVHSGRPARPGRQRVLDKMPRRGVERRRDWNPNGGPGSNDTAVLPDVGSSYTVNLDIDAAVSGLVVGASSGVHTQTFTNGSATLTVNGVIEVNPEGISQPQRRDDHRNVQGWRAP